eukprot:CAMPEP_0118720580 /NCGR_PEP_ID=MMETSP0800-20121206/30190_1 /TAXON_ID=210618 ORGANISM="Striatella unipunctata, Strain CCMP2910" /NCGR_SAMPLE_ID=MMETSP0800 /ASSEMBLY_ACC=CAM_ASM_000638 /LENGTH=344 /DNA_ID=CAMNT_0006628237 /DNA_START=137 /DNA_END=1171 /DNA_ORIENTATION=+
MDDQDVFRTPTNPDPEGNIHNSPTRPEKSANAIAARARYEAALGQRKAPNAGYPYRGSSGRGKPDPPQAMQPDPDMEFGGDDATHSPSLVLRRLQQRRAIAKANSSTSPLTNSPKVETSPGSLSAMKSPIDLMNGKLSSARIPSYRRNSSESSTPFDEIDDPPIQSRRSSTGEPRPITTASLRNHLADGNYNSISYSVRSRSSLGSSRSAPPGSGMERHMSPRTINQEIRQLDAIAAGYFPSNPPLAAHALAAATPPTIAQPRRRPKPLHEPSTGIKLRRSGDVYFPTDEARGSGIPSPEEAANSNNNIINNKSSNSLTFQSSGSEDGFNDISGNSPLHQTASL